MNGAPQWYVPLTQERDGQPTLVAFAHAGAGYAQLQPFAAACERRGVAVLGASLPGRQARLREPARTDFATLAAELTDALCPVTDRPYALFGYCSGALLAFGVLCGLAGRGAALPEHLLVVAAEAPDVAWRPRRLADLAADQLWSTLGEENSLPPALLGDPRLRAVAEPAVRADFAVLASYRHQPAPPLPVPVTVLYGERDGDLARGGLLGWRRQTSHPLRMRGLPGDHWLLEDADALAAATVAVLAEGSAGPAPVPARAPAGPVGGGGSWDQP